MKYTLVKRKRSTFAKNNSDFVNWMRKNDMQYWENNAEFMVAYSYRKLVFEKIHLRTEDEDNFVEDLQSNDLLLVDKKDKGSIFKIFKK